MIQGLGRVQSKWLSRIQAAGGVVDVHIVQHPEVWIHMKDGPPIRVPVRMMESLLEREMFEVVDDGDRGWTTYRLKADVG